MVKKGKMTVESIISTDEQQRLIVIPDGKIISQIVADTLARLEEEGENMLLLQQYTAEDRKPIDDLEVRQVFTARRASELPPVYKAHDIEYLSITGFRNGRDTVRLSANICESNMKPCLLLGITLNQDGEVESGRIIVRDRMRLDFEQTPEGPRAVESYREDELEDARDILERDLPGVFERLADLARAA